MQMLVVGISDYKVATPPDTLITYALGSCVGICLYDPASHVAGLSHIMLPDSASSPHDSNRKKFANTAIPDLIRQMERQGALRSRLTAKIAGGAQMFEIQGAKENSLWQIGQRNVMAVTQTLAGLRVPVVARDVLKNYGRTVSFQPTTGIMTVKALSHSVIEL